MASVIKKPMRVINNDEAQYSGSGNPCPAGSRAANAAEIYNKNGNKLDFYGKVNAEHDFVTSGDNTNNNDATYAQIGFKGETQINDQLTGYGQWEYRFLANQAENGAQTNKNRLAFAGLKAGDAGSIGLRS